MSVYVGWERLKWKLALGYTYEQAVYVKMQAKLFQSEWSSTFSSTGFLVLYKKEKISLGQ